MTGRCSAGLIATVCAMSNMCVHFSCRVPETFPKRLKVQAAIEGVSMGELLDTLLTEREKRLVSMRAAQLSPLHRPVSVEP
jgi:hypothetical protein